MQKTNHKRVTPDPECRLFIEKKGRRGKERERERERAKDVQNC